jgi:ribosomal protein S18 acetylase RimI-like enzyme
VLVRVATQLDEVAALDVVRADGEATGRQPSKATLAALRAVLRSPTALTLLADDDGAVVGLLVAELRGRELQLTLLCVAPAHRGRGAGRALVHALLERYPDVVAAVDDPGARALLEQGRTSQAGFDPT